MIPCLFYQALSKILGHKNTVYTYLFYQVCKVHDIVCFGDQCSNAKKSWYLSFKHFCLKLVSQLQFCERFGNDIVTIQDTSFRQKCLKLRYHDFSALEYWSLKQCHSLCTLGKTSKCWLCFHDQDLDHCLVKQARDYLWLNKTLPNIW